MNIIKTFTEFFSKVKYVRFVKKKKKILSTKFIIH